LTLSTPISTIGALSAASRNPRITVVTPSYNQADFIEQTILSVVGQRYENLEYFVFDGGSTDRTVEILRKYDGRITYWESQRDEGQAAAINAGLARATGDIICWINSDDFYLPKTFETVAAALDPARPQILAGNCMHLFQERASATGSNVPGRHLEYDLRLVDYLIQPSTFWTAAAWRRAGPLTTSLHYAFDWDWFIRAQQSGAEILTTAEYLSVYRIHAGHKSGTGADRRNAELREIYRKYSGDSYAQLFDALASKSVQRLKFAMRRAHSERWFPTVARRVWPSLLGQFSERDIRTLSQMV
jgi:glycosyltransferase involved in cell wall biosynthesis